MSCMLVETIRHDCLNSNTIRLCKCTFQRNLNGSQGVPTSPVPLVNNDAQMQFARL